jgi:lipoic acid synthetase
VSAAGVPKPADNRRIPLRVEERPPWLRARYRATPELDAMRRLVAEQRLHTVCFSAACPNLGECWGRGTATFMIGGNHCTRRCGFCDVVTARPAALDPDEPARVAEAVARLGLRFAVVTCVARDDLPDGGAGQMAATVRAIRARCPGTGVEVLIADYRGYERSLGVLRRAGELRPDIPTKSGLMLGLGERDDEVREALRDLRAAGVTLLTLGQYLRPSPDHLPVARWVTPAAFDAWAAEARAAGFLEVASGPLVRSSYRAEQLAGRP